MACTCTTTRFETSARDQQNHEKTAGLQPGRRKEIAGPEVPTDGGGVPGNVAHDDDPPLVLRLPLPDLGFGRIVVSENKYRHRIYS
jgi:hypothetical protein